MGEEGGLNLYGFVSNNGVNYRDVLGLKGSFHIYKAYDLDIFNDNKVKFLTDGFAVKYVPDPGETCCCIRLIQVLGYTGEGFNPSTGVDNGGNKTDPGYIESGGMKAGGGVLVDGPVATTPRHKGRWFIEACAQCRHTGAILGCVRFDFDNKTRNVIPNQGGAVPFKGEDDALEPQDVDGDLAPEYFDGGGYKFKALPGPTEFFKKYFEKWENKNKWKNKNECIK